MTEKQAFQAKNQVFCDYFHGSKFKAWDQNASCQCPGRLSQCAVVAAGASLDNVVKVKRWTIKTCGDNLARVVIMKTDTSVWELELEAVV